MIHGQNLLKISSDYYHEDIEPASDTEDKGEDDRLLSINSKLVKNRVKIKLEVRKSGQSSSSSSNNNKNKKKKMMEEGHVCKVCGKVFSSGKALGGHMRVHNSDGDDNAITKKPTFVEQARLGNSAVKAAAATRPTCSECGKHFPSEKSLYGHMRCHPERSWRGINPPISSARNSSSSTVDSGGAEKIDDQMDSATTDTNTALAGPCSLATWPVTARRGRKVALAPPRSADGADEVRDGEAVANLLFLAQGMQAEDRGDKTRDSISSKKVVKDYREDSSGSSDEQELVMKKKYYRDPTNGVEDGNEDSGEESESTTFNRQLDHTNTVSGNGTIQRKKKKKKKKKRKFRALDTVSSGKYKCSTCNKTFYSHQALGGHRASHKKYKSQSPCAEVEEGEFEEGEEEGAAAYEEGKSPRRLEGSNEFVEAHRCQICSKTFPTGQALGGHKRCHYVAPTETAVSSVISSPEDVQKPVIRALDFDLNEMPPMEDEVDDDVRLH